MHLLVVLYWKSLHFLENLLEDLDLHFLMLEAVVKPSFELDELLERLIELGELCDAGRIEHSLVLLIEHQPIELLHLIIRQNGIIRQQEEGVSQPVDRETAKCP